MLNVRLVTTEYRTRLAKDMTKWSSATLQSLLQQQLLIGFYNEMSWFLMKMTKPDHQNPYINRLNHAHSLLLLFVLRLSLPLVRCIRLRRVFVVYHHRH